MYDAVLEGELLALRDARAGDVERGPEVDALRAGVDGFRGGRERAGARAQVIAGK